MLELFLTSTLHILFTWINISFVFQVIKNNLAILKSYTKKTSCGSAHTISCLDPEKLVVFLSHAKYCVTNWTLFTFSDLDIEFDDRSLKCLNNCFDPHSYIKSNKRVDIIMTFVKINSYISF